MSVRQLHSVPLEKQIKFAKLVRATYMQQVRDTQCQLDPKKLRQLNEDIALLEKIKGA